MTSLQNLVPESVVRNLGWMLMHSLWQMGLVAMLAAGLFFLLRSRSANARYLAGCVALLMMVILPAATLWAVWERADPTATRVAPDWPARTIATPGPAPLPGGLVRPEQLSAGPIPVAEPWHASARNFLDAHLSWVVAGWLLGVGLSMLRVLISWLRIQRLGRCGTEAMSDAWTAKAISLARRFGVSRTVQVLQSHLAQVPATIGYLRPVILLPVAAVAGLAPQQLEAIIAHELAHIRRFDCLVNLVQVLIETVLFYHPAIWWVSRRIRIERENCCDDAAITVLNDRFAYIRALVSLEELRDAPAPQLAVAWQGTSLLDRVRRLLGAPAPRTMQSGRWMAGPAVAMAALIVTATALLVSPSQAEPQPDAQKVEAAGAASPATQPGTPLPAEKLSSRPRWQSCTIRKTQTDKEGREVQHLALSLPKEYDAQTPSDGSQQDQVKLQMWFLRAMVGTDLSATAKILGKTPAASPADKDSVLAEGEHALLNDEQLRRLLTAAKKWGPGGANGMPRPLIVPDHGAAQLAEDDRGIHAVLPQRDSPEKAPFEIMSAFRMAARAEVTSGNSTRLDFIILGVKTPEGDMGRLAGNTPIMMQMMAHAVAEVPAGRSLVMPVSNGMVKMAAYRQRSDGGNPGVDLYVEPFTPSRPFFTGFMVVRPVIVKAQGASSQAAQEVAAAAGDEFEFDLAPERFPPGQLNAKVDQLNISDAGKDDVIQVFGEPTSYLWGTQTFSKDNLPSQYIMMYPDGFHVFMSDGRIQELRFEHDSSYTWKGGLHTGSSLGDVLNVVGQPTKTVTGEEIGFQDGVLYKDAGGREGYGYYERRDQGVRMFFMNNKVTALYVMPTQPSPQTVAFNADIDAKVAQVNINQARREDIVRIFGPPTSYVWGEEKSEQWRTYQENELPPQYIMKYPAGFGVYVSDGSVQQLMFSGHNPREISTYAYRGRMRIGSSLDEAYEAMGQPDRVVEGGPVEAEDGVLYKNYDGKGWSYYARKSQGIRISAHSDKVVSMHLMRTEPSGQ